MSVSVEETSTQPGRLGEAVPPQRLRHDGLSEAERNYALAMHLAPLGGVVLASVMFWPLVFAPLVLWLVRREQSIFNDDHGREVINFELSVILLTIGLALTFIGIVLIPVLWIAALVNFIRGAIAAGNGEYFRYPMTFRFLA